MYYKISSIILNNNEQKASSASEVFVAQPDEYKESLVGRLFILLEIDSYKSKALKIINFLINNINYNYYQSEKILLREQMSDLKVEHIFETALANVNKDLIDFLEQEKIKIKPSAFNITVGVVYDNYLYISSLGKNRNFIIYPSEEEYKISDIGKKEDRSTSPPSLTKLFSDVISGPLPEDGYYFLANEALTEHLSSQQIIDTITKLPPAGAASHIQNIISRINVPVNFLGVIIKNTTSTNETQQQEDKNKDSHFFDINQTKEQTEEILKPSGAINLRNLTKRSTQIFSGSNKNSASSSKKKFRPPKNYFLYIKKIFKGIVSALSLLVQGGIWLGRIGKKGFTYLLSLRKKDTSPQEETPEETSPASKFSFTLNKLILALIVISLLGFVGSTLYSSEEKNNKEQKIAINNLISDIENNQKNIEANLLYNDKRAKELLEKNESLLADLRTKLKNTEINKEQKYKTLNSKFQEQFKELRNEIELNKAKKIATLNDPAQPTNMTRVGDSLYVADAANSSVHELSLKEGHEVSTIKNEELSIPSLEDPTVIDSNIYYWVRRGLIKVDTENSEISALPLELPENNDIKDMGSFRDSLYLLDTSNNQIYEYYSAANDFANNDPWFPKETNLEQEVDIAIDGYIYTLSSTGKVTKYLEGEKQGLQLESLMPEFEKASRIKVSPDMEGGYIYILEASRNRMAVFTKQGEFLKQYRDEDFSNIKDFYVDEENGKLYFLNSSSVYSHPLDLD